MKTLICTIILLVFSLNSVGQEKLSAEADSLLNFISNLTGKKTLSGQHCAPLMGSTRLSVVHRMTGEYPAVFGQDFGFSYPGYWDGINFRQRIVDDAIIRHNQGFIITLMWHAVLPTQDEPVKFSESIQGDLTDEEWEELITPGTNLNERWKSQVDVIAWFLKQLKYAKVPVLWRPYHEMNGGWFWWGKKQGENGYKKLWTMMYDRLVRFHGLNNLIWVYNTNEVKFGVDPHETYYPGDEYVHIVATDVYSENFNQVNYDQLSALAGDKPMAIGECGTLPSKKILKEQPNWAWFMFWYDPEGRDFMDTREAYELDNVTNLRDLPWTPDIDPTIHYPVLKN